MTDLPPSAGRHALRAVASIFPSSPPRPHVADPDEFDRQDRDADPFPPAPSGEADEEEIPPALAELESFVQHLILAHLGPEVGSLARRVCPCCGLRFMEFRRSGRLGCPHDYQVYEAELIHRASGRQDAARHVGKRPRRAWERLGSDLGQARARARLEARTRQRAAVAHEDYESASVMRDRLRNDPALALDPPGPVFDSVTLHPLPADATRPNAGRDDVNDSPALPDPSR